VSDGRDASRATWVGRSVRRKEDDRLLRGLGNFADDFSLPGQLYCEILRSPVPHARIVRVDASRATEVPGAVIAVTGQEAKQHWKPLPHLVAMMGLKQPSVYALATDKVFYEGEPVAAVAAESRYAAEDALAAIRVECEELPTVLTIDDSLGGGDRPPKSVLYEEWGDNLQLDWRFAYGDVEGAFAHADLVLSERIRVQRHSGMPLETRAVLADYDHRRRELTVRMSTQIPHQCRSAFAAIFNLPETQIRVLSGDVGGGFGNKTQVDAEAIPILLSILTKRPVKWAEKRSDWLTSGPAARDYVHEIEVAFKKDGTLLGVRDRLVGDVGCDGAVRTGGVHSLLVGGTYVPGPYRLQNYDVWVRAFVTNKAPYGPYRGFGKDVANVAMETMLHRGALALGLDPVEIRRRNLVDEFPYQISTGPILENGSFRECLDRLAAEMDLEALRKRQEQARAEGRFLGIGIASMMEPSGFAGPMSMFSGFETASVRVAPDGSVLVLTGMQGIGQGTETSIAQVAADRLGCTPDDVRVVYGDTAAVPYGLGSFSSRGSTYGAMAVYLAANQAREKLLKAASHILEVHPQDLELRGGYAFVRGAEARRLSLAEVARAIYFFPGPYATLPGEPNPIPEGHCIWTNPAVRWTPDEAGRIQIYPFHASGADGALVEVDPETGEVRVERLWGVHDVGRMINPKIVEAQLVGGAIQGFGGTICEELKYDESGRMVSRTLSSYQIPNFRSAPRMTIAHLETPSEVTPLGTKGVGEGGIIAVPTVIRLAVEDALRPFGVKVNATPLTPPHVLDMITSACPSPGPA